MTKPRSLGVLIAALGLAEIAVTLDYMAFTVALPRMAQDLHVATTELQWALSAYLLAFAAFLIVGGRLGDIFGRRKLLFIGLALFGGASFLGGVAPTVGLLIAARAIQGVGAAMFFPATQSILTNAAPKERLQWALGLLIAISSIGIAAGPFVGGALTQTLGWRWIFFVNVPVALGAIILGSRVVPESHDPTIPRSIDIPGLLTLAGALVCVTMVMDEGIKWGLTSTMTLALSGLAVVLFIAFAMIERRSSHPLVDLTMFKNTAFTKIAIVGSIANYMFAMTVLVYTLLFQDVRGFSPFVAGLALVPFSLAGALIGPSTGKLSARIGPRLPMSVGLLLTAAGFAVTALVGSGAGMPLLIGAMVVEGIGCVAAYTTTTAAGLAVVPTEKAGQAAGIILTGLVVFAAFAVTTTTTMFESFGGSPSAKVETTIWVGAAIAGATALLAGLLLPGQMHSVAATSPASVAVHPRKP